MSKKSRKKRAQKSRERSKSRQHQRPPSSRWPWWAAVVLAILAGVVGLWWMQGQRDAPAASSAPAPSEVAAASPQPTPEPAPPPNIGPVTHCVHRPAFVSQLDMGDQIYIGTNLRGYQGLTLSARQPDGSVIVYQHPSWDDAGNLAAYVLDKDGNVYVAPAPFVSLDLNPPQEQNNIYKVDTNTGVMSFFMKLPWARPPDTSNPFGIMGLTYDCDTNSLYASSVAGSTYDEEVGRIFQIDLDAVQIADQLEGVDAFGLGVYRGMQGKRLYFGSARNSGIRSVALADDGGLEQEQRMEFYLLQAPGGQDERAKKIQFPAKDEMLVKGIEFNYTMRAASDFVEHDYVYRYDPATDAWDFENVRLRKGIAE